MKTILILAVMLLSSCATMAPLPFISPEEIIGMVKAGEDSTTIINKIRISGTIYHLNANEITRLVNTGVPAAVVDYMHQTLINSVEDKARRDTYNNLWYSGYGWYSPYRYYSPYSPYESYGYRYRYR